MSKAERILGSSTLNVDGPKNWDDASTSGISVAASQSTAPTSYATTGRAQGKHRISGVAAPEREWGDESEIVPRHLREKLMVEEATDGRSDISSILRRRESSSTLVSWYDKSKQPLSISQQTSASAMAKGLPSKAQRMLDMDNVQSGSKMKKKPSKLDLSHLISRTRGHKHAQQPAQPAWSGPLLDPNYVMDSPSALSTFGPPPGNHRPERSSRLQKRPTKESLRSQHTEPSRPGTGGSNSRRGPNNLPGLSNLYEHYEQMSFRQVMDPESEELGEEAQISQKAKQASPDSHPSNSSKFNHQTHPKHHDERVISDYATRTLPQTPQAAIPSKQEHSPPNEYAASISSRHTRTSKASKRTDRSFQDSDLLEKSVLSLSSDSEDDLYVDRMKSPTSSVPNRRFSDAESADFRPTTSRTNGTSGSADNKRLSILSKSSKGSKRASFAPTNTYLTIPSEQGKPSTANPRSGSISGSSVNTIQESLESPSPRVSTTSNSSANTAATWQSQPGYGIQEARAVTVHHAHGPSESGEDDEQEHAYKSRGSMSQSTSQPTPPLSPSSVDFYIRSAHSSVDGPGSSNRLMAVTRQEEMLLAALRHKRQVMRETILSEFEDERSDKQQPIKIHQTKPSEATIVEEDFDFDFPAPPTTNHKTTLAPNGTKVLDLSKTPTNATFDRPYMASGGSSQASSKKGIKKNSRLDVSEDDRHDRILLYLDNTSPSNSASGSKPSLKEFIELQEDNSSESELPEEVIYARRQQRSSSRQSSRRDDSRHKSRSPSARHSDMSTANSNRNSNRSSSRTVKAAEQSHGGESGVPRPDSPISPEGLGAPPPKRSNINRKMARLSAVGPARWGDED